MHILSSDEYDSFLRSPIEALNNFSWDKVMTEFSLPTLFTLLQFLIPNAADKKAFVCFCRITTIEVQTSAYESHSACYIWLVIW